MFKPHELSNLTNSELISLANDEYAVAYARHYEVHRLMKELAQRLESLDYMVQETLEGQEAAKEYVPK